MLKNVLSTVIGILIGGLLFTGVTSTADTTVNQQSDQTTISEVQPLNLNIFLDGEKVQLSKFDGFFYNDGKYVHSSILYNDTIYVPLYYFSNLTPGYQIYEENNTIFINSPYNYNEIINNTSVEPIPINNQNNTQNNNQINIPINTQPSIIETSIKYEDLILYGPNIKPLENAEAIIQNIKNNYSDAIVYQSGNYYFVTDSQYTDTSYFLGITKNENNQILGVYYDQFTRPYQGSLNVSTHRGIRIKESTVSDVIKAYGDDYSLDSHTFPDGSNSYTLRYNFYINHQLNGDLVFIADGQKGQSMENAVIYSFGFELQ